jgi:hypothetical protein
MANVLGQKRKKEDKELRGLMPLVNSISVMVSREKQHLKKE